MKIGFLGPRGTFSEKALKLYNAGNNYEAVEFSDFYQLISAADSGLVDEAVVPVENSIEGNINITLDMLAFDTSLKVKAELMVSIENHLMVKKGTGKRDIRIIISHPQPIGQCTNFLSTNFPDVEIQFSKSTAEAAGIVSASDGSFAAVASRESAGAYGLEIISENIQDRANNVTRFIVLTKTYDDSNTAFNKTSIVFSTEDKPGSLYRILQILDLWNLNMTKIESRPSKQSLGTYVFFVDFEGNIHNADVEDALKMIKRKTTFFRILGSY